MDTTTRAFIYASLAYLAVGALLGLGIGVVPELFLDWRFAHVHLLLLGFMAMMIYGVGYFVLPRFNATTVRWPRLLSVHLWSANIGLLGMCATHDGLLLPDVVDSTPFFVLFAAVEVGSILLFVVNLWATLAQTQPGPSQPVVPATPQPAPTPPSPPRQAFTFTLDTPVAEFLERQPAAVAILGQWGVKELDDPKTLANLAKFKVTLGRLAATHGLPERELLAEINRGGEKPPVKPLKLDLGGGGSVAMEGGAQGPCRATDIIGDVLKRHPETTAVFQDKFGAGCFTCPGQATESIAQAAMMHNLDPQQLVDALNTAVRQGEGG